MLFLLLFKNSKLVNYIHVYFIFSYLLVILKKRKDADQDRGLLQEKSLLLHLLKVIKETLQED